jgi:hypothetical protein
LEFLLDLILQIAEADLELCALRVVLLILLFVFKICKEGWQRWIIVWAMVEGL